MDRRLQQTVRRVRNELDARAEAALGPDPFGEDLRVLLDALDPKPVRTGPGGITEQETRKIAAWTDQDVQITTGRHSEESSLYLVALAGREACRQAAYRWEKEDMDA